MLGLICSALIVFSKIVKDCSPVKKTLSILQKLIMLRDVKKEAKLFSSKEAKAILPSLYAARINKILLYEICH